MGTPVDLLRVWTISMVVDFLKGPAGPVLGDQTRLLLTATRKVQEVLRGGEPETIKYVTENLPELSERIGKAATAAGRVLQPNSLSSYASRIKTAIGMFIDYQSDPEEWRERHAQKHAGASKHYYLDPATGQMYFVRSHSGLVEMPAGARVIRDRRTGEFRVPAEPILQNVHAAPDDLNHAELQAFRNRVMHGPLPELARGQLSERAQISEALSAIARWPFLQRRLLPVIVHALEELDRLQEHEQLALPMRDEKDAK
jgi:hypothetical protein